MYFLFIFGYFPYLSAFLNSNDFNALCLRDVDELENLATRKQISLRNYIPRTIDSYVLDSINHIITYNAYSLYTKAIMRFIIKLVHEPNYCIYSNVFNSIDNYSFLCFFSCVFIDRQFPNNHGQVKYKYYSEFLYNKSLRYAYGKLIGRSRTNTMNCNSLYYSNGILYKNQNIKHTHKHIKKHAITCNADFCVFREVFCYFYINLLNEQFKIFNKNDFLLNVNAFDDIVINYMRSYHRIAHFSIVNYASLWDKFGFLNMENELADTIHYYYKFGVLPN